MLITIDPLVKEVTWCERPSNQKRTLRPRIWLIAALSFSVHSATTLARISFIYSMKAFRGFLMWGLLGSCSFLCSCWDFLEKQEEERVKKEGEELLCDTGKYKKGKNAQRVVRKRLPQRRHGVWERRMSDSSHQSEGCMRGQSGSQCRKARSGF